ncbi:transposase [Paenibacillus humicola]|uniref:transposase n=1 Tax=Paenibacillus humicola TaxID=3110540 RepID=UPI00237B28FE|nr:transposase [Paenibacillus humicola]
MRGTLAEQMEATIYQYQLIRKINIRSELKWSHSISLLILLAYELVSYGIKGVIPFLVGLCGVLLLQIGIIRLTLWRLNETTGQRWGWRLQLPWAGYIPTAPIELALLRRLDRHLLGLGICTTGLIYPWAAESLFMSFLIWHLWFITPRIVILHMLRKEKRSGVVMLHGKEVSYYHR